MTQQRPTAPLVVVLGSTGTGKSDLAVELARKFDGEIINADAMQMYRGLPVTTNKISVDEQRGVPHHLLGTIALHEPTWHVDRFRREASRIIAEIRGRGRLPIVVGGSHYYLDGLLFDDHLVNEAEDGGAAAATDSEEAAAEEGLKEKHSREMFPILEEPTEAIFAELQRVDPAMAERWHPNDRRKIQRSLEIYLKTGRRASDIYTEQRQRRAEKEKARDVTGNADGTLKETDSEQRQQQQQQQQPWQSLLLWVYAKRDILNARLDGRIDAMLERGLETETAEMYATLQDLEARRVPVDRSKGIWQSIGYKEMEPYIAARESRGDDAVDANALTKLREAGLDGIKFATRRYARYQLRWIKHKTIPYLVDAHALDHLFLLDSTDKAQWQQNVADVGVQLVATFLGAGPAEQRLGTLPKPVDVSETAREVLTATIAASRESDAKAGKPAYRQDCAVCRVTLLSEDQWHKHMRGTRHRRVVQKQKRRALVPVKPVEEVAENDAASEEFAQAQPASR